MPISAKRKLIAGATGLVVLAGGGGTYAAAAGQSATPAKPADRAAEQKAFFDDVAKRLNVTRDQLDAAIKGAAEARIDAAVAAGRMTKEQGEAAKKALGGRGVPLLGPGILGGRPGGHGGPGARGFGFGFGPGLDGAADYLGLTEAQLREQIRDGKSLADVAKAQNKSVDGLKAALKAKITERLDQAVKDGHLTADQRTKALANVDQMLDDVIDGKPPTPPDGPRRPHLRWR